MKSAIERLPVSDAERRTILALSQKPSQLSLYTAAVFALSGALFTVFSFGAFTYTFHPPVTTEPVAALTAFYTARAVANFFIGVFQLMLALLNVLQYYHSRRVRHAIELLVQPNA